MSGNQRLTLVSMYLHQPVLGAHGIALELEATAPDRLQGKARLDPNTCTLDLWGDRGACTLIAIAEPAIEATKMETEDPQRLGRVHWSLEFEGMPEAKVNLIELPSAGLRYLTVEEDGAITAIVPLFHEGLFVPEACDTVE